MNPNMGTADRAIRVVIAVAIAVLYFTGTVQGVLGIALLVVAAVFLMTSVAGRCPAYLPLGLSTCRKSKTPTG